jgi:hypothetical protein
MGKRSAKIMIFVSVVDIREVEYGFVLERLSKSILSRRDEEL